MGLKNLGEISLDLNLMGDNYDKSIEDLREKKKSENTYKAIINTCSDTQLVTYLKNYHLEVWNEFKQSLIDEIEANPEGDNQDLDHNNEIVNEKGRN